MGRRYRLRDDDQHTAIHQQAGTPLPARPRTTWPGQDCRPHETTNPKDPFDTSYLVRQPHFETWSRLCWLEAAA